MSVAVVKAIIKCVDSGSVWLTTFKAQEFTEGNLVALCLHCMQYHIIAKNSFQLHSRKWEGGGCCTIEQYRWMSKLPQHI